MVVDDGIDLLGGAGMEYADALQRARGGHDVDGVGAGGAGFGLAVVVEDAEDEVGVALFQQGGGGTVGLGDVEVFLQLLPSLGCGGLEEGEVDAEGVVEAFPFDEGGADACAPEIAAVEGAAFPVVEGARPVFEYQRKSYGKGYDNQGYDPAAFHRFWIIRSAVAMASLLEDKEP